MKQLTKGEAIALYDSKVWENWTNEQIVRFQLFQDKLAIPFGRFHEAIESVLGRGVFTHEFAYRESLIEQYLGCKEPPTFNEIMDLIPKEKVLLILK
jgi:hypothetical protein